jgi:hypothetical protein
MGRGDLFRHALTNTNQVKRTLLLAGPEALESESSVASSRHVFYFLPRTEDAGLKTDVCGGRSPVLSGHPLGERSLITG